MLREVLTRRLKNEWKKPDLILVDGGMGQVNALKEIIKKFNLKIKIIGIAKGVKRKENKIIGKIPSFTNLKTLIKVRDEAHRFAIFYHRKIRNKNFIQKLT
jgi:excinuclease ABC subunit C